MAERRSAPRISWPQLGWRPIEGTPGVSSGKSEDGPGFSAGPVCFFVIAPWCPDCQEAGPRLAQAAPHGVPVWLVGEFAPASEIAAYAAHHALTWPILVGTSEKSEIARNEARFRQLREAWGDTRHWGLPLMIVGRIENGWLIAESIQTEL